MSLDRVVHWRRKKPTKKELSFVLEDYLGGAGEVKWQADRWYCTLPGKPSSPFRRILSRTTIRSDARWFEVYIDEEGLDVITRSADHYTNVVAKGFAEIVAQFWQGQLESDEYE